MVELLAFQIPMALILNIKLVGCLSYLGLPSRLPSHVIASCDENSSQDRGEREGGRFSSTEFEGVQCNGLFLK